MMICSPGGIRGQRTSATSASLTWDEPYAECPYCPSAIGYEVAGEGIATISLIRPPCVINGLKADEEYFVLIYAKAAGNLRSNPSRARIGFYVPESAGPSIPENLRPILITSHSITVAWSPPQGGSRIVAYKVYLDTQYQETITGTEYTFSGLTSSMTYILSVRAVDAAGNSSIARTIESRTASSNAPTSLECVRVSFQLATLQWKPPLHAPAISGYEISRDGVVMRETAELYTLFNDLQAGTTYLFEVRARNDGVLSDPASIRG